MWNNRMWQLVSAHRVVVMEIHLRAGCIKELHQLCSQPQNWSNSITNALFSISSPVNTRAQSLQSKWKCQKSRRTLLPDRPVLSALSVSLSCRAGKAQTDCRANSKDFPGCVCPGINPVHGPELVDEALLDADWHLVPDWWQIWGT